MTTRGLSHTGALHSRTSQRLPGEQKLPDVGSEGHLLRVNLYLWSQAGPQEACECSGWGAEVGKAFPPSSLHYQAFTTGLSHYFLARQAH